MAYDPEEMIAFRGKMITKDVIFHKVKSLGWNTRLFGELTDEQMIQTMEERKTPTQMGKSLEVVFKPTAVPNLDSDEGNDPSLMAPMGSQPLIDNTPLPSSVEKLESGVVLAGVAPSTRVAAQLRPVDPTKPPMSPTQTQAFQPAPRVISVKPPKTDTAKLMSMMDAAFQLAGNDVTLSTAKVLITTNGLERAFQSMYPELAKRVLGRMDMTPDVKCRGGTVLEIEVEAENGYVHIITSAGTITITGNNIAHKGADQ